MGLEFSVTKELASASTTLIELVALTRAIQQQLPRGDFVNQFNHIMGQLYDCYSVIEDNFKPFLAMDNQNAFDAQFDELYAHYSANFLKEASKARPTVEHIYEYYQELKLLKEFKSTFPMLKWAVSRLHDYIDKWIDNDTWFMMTLDRIFKLFNRFLQEISDFKRKDAEDAFSIYALARGDFALFVTILEQKRAELGQMVK
jgi:hypothetical protein